MGGVAPTAVTELAELEAVGVVPPVLHRGVVPFLAVGTLQSDDRRPALRRSHVFASTQKINLAALGQVGLYQRAGGDVHGFAAAFPTAAGLTGLAREAVGTMAPRGPK